MGRLLAAILAAVLAGGAAAAGAGHADSGAYRGARDDATLYLYLAGNGSGSVAISPGGTTCQASCQATIATGATVTLTASPAPDSAVSSWSSDLCQEQGSAQEYSGTTCTFVFTGQSAQVDFESDTLYVYLAGNGGGSVSASPPGYPAPGIAGCTASCHANYAPGTRVTLRAAPAAGSAVSSWSSDLCQEQGSAQEYGGTTCTFVFTGQSAQVDFQRDTLYVYVAGDGQGSVSASPPGLPAPGIARCAASCKADYAPGTKVALTATPAAGSTIESWSDGVCREQGNAQEYSGSTCTLVVSGQSAQVSFAKGAAPAPAPAGPTLGSSTPPPPPVPGVSVDVEPATGTTLVKLPGQSTFRRLVGGAQIPVGSVVDATKGQIGLTSSGGSSAFSKGTFVVREPRAGGAARVTTLALAGGNFAVCAAKGKRKTQGVAARPTAVVRQLFGNGKGRFRTTGRYASAAVRGTAWLVQDRCDGTLTRVTRGVVAVTDLARHRVVLVTAGRSYLAKRR